MNAQIKITFTKEIQEDNTYEVSAETSDAVQMTDKIFVLKIVDNSFARVASERELSEIPEVPTNGWNEYRSREFTKVFEDDEKAQALAFIEGVIGVTDRLVENINAEEFEGEEVVSFPFGLVGDSGRPDRACAIRCT